MANQEQLDILKQGISVWNTWREAHPNSKPDLRNANLRNADLSRANLSYADLTLAMLMEADLSGSNLVAADLRNAYLGGADLRNACLNEATLGGASLSRADLRNAYLVEANLDRVNLTGATLTGATLSGAKFSRADLSGADLSGANLDSTTFVRTNLTNTILENCRVYGISAWDIQLDGAKQYNLTITPVGQLTVTVDNLKIAQFIYLLLNNEEIREAINTLTTKSVLILGRFSPERKAILDALRDSLRKHNYLPILFDFEKPSSRNFTETIRTLAHLARFIIADLTDPASIPQELQAIVPTLAVPVQPVLLEGKREYAMFTDFLKTYHWVLPIHYYKDQTDMLATLREQVIEPAEQKAQELEKR